MIKQETIELNDGNHIPMIGLGTVKVKGAVGKNAVLTAINKGYRYIDSSTNYNNEGMVGQAIRESSVPREDLFIGSKLPGAHHDYDSAIKMIQESLYRMGLDYFDQYLIHWPLPMQDQYVEAWTALIDAQKYGLIKSIGVSNFLPKHLDRLIKETGVTPAINQSERHPYFINEEVVRADKDRGVLTQAWSPLGRGYLNDVLTNETIAEVAKKYDKNNAQVIIRWNLQNEVLPVVKAAQPDHQTQNLDIFDFELSKDDLATLDNLDRGEEGRVEGQDPETFEEYD